jgi:hypothetical protein
MIDADETSDPLLTMLRDAAPVSDEKLSDQAVRVAIANLAAETSASSRVRTRPARILLAAGIATILAVAGTSLLNAGDELPQASPSAAFAGQFQRVAAEFPLPAGGSYEPLKNGLTDVSDASSLRSKVAKYSACVWLMTDKTALTEDGPIGLTSLNAAQPTKAEVKAAIEHAAQNLSPAEVELKTAIKNLKTGDGTPPAKAQLGELIRKACGDQR